MTGGKTNHYTTADLFRSSRSRSLCLRLTKRYCAGTIASRCKCKRDATKQSTQADRLILQWPCGLMDKALVFGTKDCRFKSCQGHSVLGCFAPRTRARGWGAVPFSCAVWVLPAPPQSAKPPWAKRIGTLRSTSACSVAVSYKPPMLVTRARLPACAYFFAGCGRLQRAAGD